MRAITPRPSLLCRVIGAGAILASASCNASPKPRPPTSAHVAVDPPPPNSSWASCIESDDPCPRLGEALARCGTVPIRSRFVGPYDLDAARSFPPESASADATADARAAGADDVEETIQQFSNFVVEPTRIHTGGPLVQEFCFIEVREQTENVFDAVVLWQEDVARVGDASLSYVRLEREGGELRFWHYYSEEERREGPLYLRTP